MFAARSCAASTRQVLRTQAPRRFGSSHAHAEPVNEGFGVSYSPPNGLKMKRRLSTDRQCHYSRLLTCGFH